MTRYVLRRLIQAIPILDRDQHHLFLIVYLAPGSTRSTVSGRAASRQQTIAEPHPAVRAGQAPPRTVHPAGSPPSGVPLERRRRGAIRSSTGGRSPRRSPRGPLTLLADGHGPARHGARRHPARHPGGGQAVQLGRQDHHDPRDHRLRACRRSGLGHPAALRLQHPARDRTAPLPALRPPDAGQRRTIPATCSGTSCCRCRAWPSSRSPAGAATCAPRCSRSSTRTTCGRPRPRACAARASSSSTGSATR